MSIEVFGVRRITPKERRFITEYLIDLDQEKAAVRACYPPEAGATLLADPMINKAVASAINHQESRRQVGQDYVLHEMKEMYEECRADGRASYGHALKALEMMGRHVGMFREEIHVTHKKDIRDFTTDELFSILERHGVSLDATQGGDRLPDRVHEVHPARISDGEAPQADSQQA